MALQSCVECGGKVSSRANTCPHCGCPVETAAVAPEPRPTAPRAPEARKLPLELLSVAGFSSLQIDRAVTLGRTRANLLVEHPAVAATHCRLTPKGDHWEIEDLSGAGVYASPAQASHVMLFGGGVVDVGGFPGAVGMALPGVLDVPVPLRLRTPGAPDVGLRLEKLPMLVGRAPWVDLPLVDRNVSHTHARLRLDGHRLLVDDMNSRNGTFVGDVRVGTGHVLRVGDRMRLGETEIVFGEALGAPGDHLETDPSMPMRGRRPEPLGRAPIIATTRLGQEHGTVRVPAGRDGGCPACHGAFELKRGGVVIATTEASASRARSRVGHCSTCGVRLASCPACAAANLAPQLVAQASCRDCAEPFEAR